MAVIDSSIIPYVSTFLFTFAVVFGLLSYSKVGAFTKRINAVIAIAIALFAIFYQPLVLGLQEFMPIAVVLMIVVFFLLFLKKLFAHEKGGDNLPNLVALGSLLIVLAAAGDKIAKYLPGNFDSNTVIWLVGVAIFVLFFWSVYTHQGGGGQSGTTGAGPVRT